MQFSVEIVAAIGLLMGLMAWFFGLHAIGTANTKAISEMKISHAAEVKEIKSDAKEKQKAMEERHNELAKKVERLDTKLVEKLSEIEKSLAKIEGKLGVDT